MNYVNLVSYTIQVNDHLLPSIVPRKGLRHEDLLSLYLCILCVEGLTRLLRKKGLNLWIKSVTVVRGNPKISHLLFVYDSFIFMELSENVYRHMKLVLGKYELASGKKINVEKLVMSFSPNTYGIVKTVAQNVFGISW